MLASQHENVKPDGVVLGKALGGGLLPVSAFIARADVMDVFTPGDHGSTFAGNPLCTAAANAVLDILADERLTQNAATVGAYLKERLKPLGSTRGMGLMIGLELDKPIAKKVVAEALALGLIINATGDTTLRIIPPLILTKELADEGVNLLTQAIARAAL